MRIRTAHIALQFSDSDQKHTQDIEKIFARAVERRWAWFMGTESGPGSGNTGAELVRVARESGYRPWVPEHQGKGIASRTDGWIMVREDLINSGWKQDFLLGIPSSDQIREEGVNVPPGKQWGRKGVTIVEFKNDRFGVINLGVAHYLTDARNPSSPFWKYNKKLAGIIGTWAKKVGKGHALAFYSGDQNMADDKNDEPQGDTFMGQPLTSAWDELHRYESTGHGNIDVIASYNKDGRVKAQSIVALDDKEFFLNTDHYLVEAVYSVDPLKR